MMMKKVSLRVVMVVALAVASASASVSPQGVSGITTATELKFVVATTKETKLTLIEKVSFPSNVLLEAAVELSPVSVNGTLEATVTPVPFLRLVAGGAVGTGWNIPIADGLRVNERRGAHDAELTGSSFSGLVWGFDAAGVFQFDFAAIRPGDWNHAVLRVRQGVSYRAFTGAGAGESWLYEADDGENRNGWSYFANYFAGYRMPLVLDTIGVYAESERYLYDTPGGSSWGDDLLLWKFGPLLNFAIGKRTSIALLAQWETVREYTGGTEHYGFYQDRVLTDGNELSIRFYRAALSVTVRLR